MWTHYCKQHSGVCIEFDREELSKSLRGWGLFTCNMFGRDVEYRDIRNKPSYDGVNSYLYQLLTKSKDWEYEQEVRLFIDTPSWTLAKDYVPAEEYGVRRSLFRRLKYKYQPCCKDVSKQKFYPSFDPKFIKAVYLGARFPKENVRRIIELAMKANPEVTVLRMRADQDNLRLVPEPVGRPR